MEGDPYCAESTPTRGGRGSPARSQSSQAVPPIKPPLRWDVSILGRVAADPTQPAPTSQVLRSVPGRRQQGRRGRYRHRLARDISRGRVVFGGSHLRDVILNKLDPAHGWYVDLPSVGAGAFSITRVGDVGGEHGDVSFIVANAAISTDKRATPQGAAFILTAGRWRADMRDLTKTTRPFFSASIRRRGLLQTVSRVGGVNGDGTAVTLSTSSMRD